MDRKFLFIFIFLIILSSVFSIDEAEKIYFQQLQEKLIAQVNAKIDTQTNKIETNLKNSVENVKSDIKQELSNEIKSSLRAVAIGLAGLIIITLAVFKIIDLKITYTRNIKKYEKMLNDKVTELDKLILQANNERNQLKEVREKLMEYKNKLQNWEKHLQKQQEMINDYFTTNIQKNPNLNLYPPNINFSEFPLPPPLQELDKKEQKKRPFNTFIFIILIILLIMLLIYLYNIYFV